MFGLQLLLSVTSKSVDPQFSAHIQLYSGTMSMSHGRVIMKGIMVYEFDSGML